MRGTSLRRPTHEFVVRDFAEPSRRSDQGNGKVAPTCLRSVDLAPPSGRVCGDCTPTFAPSVQVEIVSVGGMVAADLAGVLVELVRRQGPSHVMRGPLAGRCLCVPSSRLHGACFVANERWVCCESHPSRPPSSSPSRAPAPPSCGFSVGGRSRSAPGDAPGFVTVLVSGRAAYAALTGIPLGRSRCRLPLSALVPPPLRGHSRRRGQVGSGPVWLANGSHRVSGSV